MNSIFEMQRPKMFDGMDCVHEPGSHCSEVSYPWTYAVTKDGKFVRWSTPDDPPFPCLCRCVSCNDWRQTKEEIDGPLVLPTE